MTFAIPKIPADELSRLQAVRDFHILDTEAEVSFDDLTQLASQICQTPIALLSVVDEKRQWFKSKIGTDAVELPREISFCAHAINQIDVMVVEDASKDKRFAENPLVTHDPKIRFYAGAVLRTSDGHNIGTLCVVDHVARKLTKAQIDSLRSLARQVIIALENRVYRTSVDKRDKFISSIVGLLPDLICYIDSDLTYRYLNPAYATWYKVNAQNWIGKPVQEVLHPEVYLRAIPFMKSALAGQAQDFQTELPFHIHGQVVNKTVHASYLPDRNESGKIIGFFAVVRDISKYKELERAALNKSDQLRDANLRAVISEKSFRAIFDHSPLGIIQLNSKLEFVAMNSAYCNCVGYTADELKAKTMLDLTHPDDRQLTKNTIAKFIAGTGQLTRFEKRYIHKNGNVIWGLVSSRAVKFEETGEIFLYSIIEDITEIHHKDIELKEAQAMLVSAAKMASLGQMAAGVAHEINNPLAIIQGRTEILLKRLKLPQLVDPEKIATDLEIIHKTCHRIQKIVTGLKNFSRRANSDAMEKVNAKNLIDETLALCLEKFKLNEIAIKVDCSECIEFAGRATEVSQVLMNLLNNAFDAVMSLSDKWVEISVKVDGPVVKFTVTDSGAGLEQGVIDRLMEPFFTTKEVGKGTGLGLSVSRGIIESYGGKLSYLNGPHTCFAFEIPERQSQVGQRVA